MGSRGGIGGKTGAPSSPVWAVLALCLLLSRCLPCEGRKLLAAEEEGGKVMLYFEGGLVLRVSPPPSIGNSGGSGEEAAAVPNGFSASGRAARLMRSVPSPGVGH